MEYIALVNAIELLKQKGISIHPETLRRAIRAKKIPAILIGKGYHVKTMDLLRWAGVNADWPCHIKKPSNEDIKFMADYSQDAKFKNGEKKK